MALIDVSEHKNVENVIRYFLRYLPPRGAESILDIGGGEGCLSAFIPDLKYCLVEPTKNGISGLKIPFPEKYEWL